MYQLFFRLEGPIILYSLASCCRCCYCCCCKRCRSRRPRVCASLVPKISRYFWVNASGRTPWLLTLYVTLSLAAFWLTQWLQTPWLKDCRPGQPMIAVALIALLGCTLVSAANETIQQGEGPFFDIVFLLMCASAIFIVGLSSAAVCCMVRRLLMGQTLSEVSTSTEQIVGPTEEQCQSRHRKRDAQTSDSSLRSRSQSGVSVPQKIYFTSHGEVWHTSLDCAKKRTQGEVHSKRPCKFCAFHSFWCWHGTWRM